MRTSTVQDIELDNDDPFSAESVKRERARRGMSREQAGMWDRVCDIKFPLWGIDKLTDDCVGTLSDSEYGREILEQFDILEMNDLILDLPPLIGILKRRKKAGLTKYHFPADKARDVFRAAAIHAIRSGRNYLGEVLFPLRQHPELHCDPADFLGWNPGQKPVRFAKDVLGSEAIKGGLDTLKDEIDRIGGKLRDLETESGEVIRLYKRLTSELKTRRKEVNRLKQQLRRKSS